MIKVGNSFIFKHFFTFQMGMFNRGESMVKNLYFLKTVFNLKKLENGWTKRFFFILDS